MKYSSFEDFLIKEAGMTLKEYINHSWVSVSNMRHINNDWLHLLGDIEKNITKNEVTKSFMEIIDYCSYWRKMPPPISASGEEVTWERINDKWNHFYKSIPANKLSNISVKMPANRNTSEQKILKEYLNSDAIVSDL